MDEGKVFYDLEARKILEKDYFKTEMKRDLVKTIHRAGCDHGQIDSILYSLKGSPAKGILMISVANGRIQAMRLLHAYGKIMKTYKKYYYWHIA